MDSEVACCGKSDLCWVKHSRPGKDRSHCGRGRRYDKEDRKKGQKQADTGSTIGRRGRQKPGACFANVSASHSSSGAETNHTLTKQTAPRSLNTVYNDHQNTNVWCDTTNSLYPKNKNRPKPAVSRRTKRRGTANKKSTRYHLPLPSARNKIGKAMDGI